MSLVLDTSATLAWIYHQETTQPILDLLERVTQSGAWVPGLWRLEVANVLEMGVRRERHDAAFREETLADLALLPILTDTETEKHAWSATIRLVARHRLTLYDAAYLELAMRRGLPLASVDVELRAAAKMEEVPLLGQ